VNVKIAEGKQFCPECGDLALGSTDLVPGAAYIDFQPDGSFDWAGETEVFWDGQYNARPDGSPVPMGTIRLQCPTWVHEWETELMDL
jgi:hypothetical protein